MSTDLGTSERKLSNEKLILTSMKVFSPWLRKSRRTTITRQSGIVTVECGLRWGSSYFSIFYLRSICWHFPTTAKEWILPRSQEVDVSMPNLIRLLDGFAKYNCIRFRYSYIYAICADLCYPFWAISGVFDWSPSTYLRLYVAINYHKRRY